MNKTIFNNILAALALTLAALATPSALAVKALVGGYYFGGSTGVLFEGIGNTRNEAYDNAIANCELSEDIIDEDTFDCETYSPIYLSAVNGIPSCFGYGVSNISFGTDGTFNRIFPVTVNAEGITDAEMEAAITSGGSIGLTNCGNDNPSTLPCNTGNNVVLNGELVPNNNGNLSGTPSQVNGTCDTIGVICEGDDDDKVINNETGSCTPCPTNSVVSEDNTRCVCNAEFLDTWTTEYGMCDACPTNSVASSDQSTCVCNAGFLETYESEGMCEVCPDGYTANAAQDDCICSDNSLVTASGHCEPCTADNPLADKENNRCIRATEQTTCQTYFLDTTPILNEFGECVAAATTADCSLVYPASAPLYNETTKQCEAPDCPAARPVYDEGNCRATIPEDCANGEIFQNSNCVARGDDDKVNNRAIVIGLIMVGAFVADSWSDERDSELNWTPSYAFNTNNGNVSYSVGSRWTAKTENFGYYWQTAKSGSGDIRYSSGIGYNNGIMQANIDSEGTREDTDIDLSISAQKTWGLWNIGGGYRIDTRLTPTESKTRNRLNLTAKYKIDQWILSATANTTGKKSTARINYSYRF